MKGCLRTQIAGSRGVNIHKMLRYVPRGSAETTVVRLSNGDPLLQEIRTGRGTVFVFAIAPDLGWSNLPLRGLFVPLLYRSIQYLSAGSALEGEQLVVGQPALVTVASTGSRVASGGAGWPRRGTPATGAVWYGGIGYRTQTTCARECTISGLTRR